MRLFLSLFILSLGLISFGCVEEVEVESIEYSKVCNVENNGKEIVTSGFLDDMGALYCTNESGLMQCGMILKEKSEDKKGFNAAIYTGDQNNRMNEVKDKYEKSDIVIRDNEGITIDLSKKVKVSGGAAIDEKNCGITVYKIEQ